jgi:hypothetical protein
MPDDTVRVLYCLFKGATSFMRISLSVDDDVYGLQAMVRNMGKNRILRDANIPDLFVWKVRTTLRLEWMFPLTTWQLKKQESLVPEESLGDRVFSQGHLSTIAVKLEPGARIGDIFEDQPKLGLHIVVQHVCSRECERLSIRRHRVSTISQTQSLQVRLSNPTFPLAVSHIIVLLIPVEVLLITLPSSFVYWWTSSCR